MKIKLQRVVPKDIFEELKELEEKYKFEKILKTGIDLLKNLENANPENILKINSFFNKTEVFLNKFENLLKSLNESLGNLKNISWILSKDLREVKEKIDEVSRDRYYFILKKYKILYKSYREDISGLITILRNYLPEDQLRFYVRKFNRKFKEYEI